MTTYTSDGTQWVCARIINGRECEGIFWKDPKEIEGSEAQYVCSACRGRKRDGLFRCIKSSLEGDGKIHIRVVPAERPPESSDHPSNRVCRKCNQPCPEGIFAAGAWWHDECPLDKPERYWTVPEDGVYSDAHGILRTLSKGMKVFGDPHVRMKVGTNAPHQPDATDPVDHPKHYTSHPSGVECITIIQWWTANIAMAGKYLWRHGLKPGTDALTDLRKARRYIDYEITRLEAMEKKQ